MLTHLTVHLNNATQQRIPAEAATSWFAALPAEQQRTALNSLVLFIGQAGAPRPRDIATVQQALGQQHGTITRHNLHLTLGKLIDTTADAGTFTLLMAMFTVLDRRRRDTRCAAGCLHWWHQLDQHPAVVDYMPLAGHDAAVRESPHDRRTLTYCGAWPGVTGPWLIRLEIPSLHDKPESGAWYGGRTLYSQAQPSRTEALNLAQLWLDDGVYPSGPEDHLDRNEPQFTTGQPGVYIGQCERCHACGYDCPHDRCGQYEAVPVVHTQRCGLLVCREHLDDDVPVDFRNGTILSTLT